MFFFSGKASSPIITKGRLGCVVPESGQSLEIKRMLPTTVYGHNYVKIIKPGSGLSFGIKRVPSSSAWPKSEFDKIPPSLCLPAPPVSIIVNQ